MRPIKNLRWWIAGLLAIATALFGLVVGWLVEHQGYGPAFAVAGVLHPLAFFVILFSVRRVVPLYP